jgi:prephenate dehydratase
MKAVYPGARGAFAHIACGILLSDHVAEAVPTFEAVAQELAEGHAAAGVLPLRNNIAGAVPNVEAIIRTYELEINEMLDLPIRLHLAGLPGSTIGGVRTVASHPIALAQCSRALSSLGVDRAEAANTAIAAQQLSDVSVAVLASEDAVRLYGLHILDHDMQDRNSVTTFIALSRRDPRA